MNKRYINIANLAYLGDSVYELEVRKRLLTKEISKVNDLKNESLKYVSAVSQHRIINLLKDKNIFTDEELEFIKSARNYKPNSKPRYTDIKTYKMATALEALFGKLYLSGKFDRIDELMKGIFGEY